MTSTIDRAERTERRTPTIWGCTPQLVHDRYWAAFGVQVVRQRQRTEIVSRAELFLLCEEGTLVIFSLPSLVDTLYWVSPQLLMLRVRHAGRSRYREVAVTEGDRLVRFERVYRDSRARWTRVAITSDRDLARAWLNCPRVRSPWRWLRSQVDARRRLVRRVDGRVYDEHDEPQVMECMREVLRRWDRPDATIRRPRRRGESVWSDESAQVHGAAQFVGRVWVGAGRRLDPEALVVGPAILWDDPASRAEPEELTWFDIEPPRVGAGRGAVRAAKRSQVPGKRAFDVVFALVALLLFLPLFPIVALAILLEDGGPVFFAHRRETIGGREFGCLKFRSMRKQADVARAELARANRADGPQFYVPDDPRVTRVGRILRRLQIDELPQLLNVLVGHMSFVGPRPSPYSENQYCPAWREARLSVRPGLTGLWQVSRTRSQGLDFQEWIRFDLEYVERADWGLDLRILARTVGVVVRGLA